MTKFLRKLLFIPIRILMLVFFALLVVALVILFFFCTTVYDPLRWILTGKYTTFDDRGDILVDNANKILDYVKKPIERLMEEN